MFDFLEKVNPFIATNHQAQIFPNSTHLLGIAFDGTTSFRPGARFGPNSLREASYGLESYSNYLDKDLEDFSILDLGNLPFYPSRQDILREYFDQVTKDLDLKKDNIKLLTLGGEHSISYAPITLYLRQFPDLVLLHLDAHADLRDGYLKEHFSHASIICRVLDHFLPDHQLIQYGIRSGTKEEFQRMKDLGSLKLSLDELCKTLEKIPNSRPIYLTLDLDFFDPGFFPGTGTPEAGGESFHSFIKIIKILAAKNFVGADITELAPMLDPSGNSSCFASKVTREVLLALAPIRKKD